MLPLFSVLINVPNIRVYPTDNLRLLGLTRNPFVKPKTTTTGATDAKPNDNYDDDDEVTAVAPFVVLHVIIITSNGKVNNKQPTTSGNEKAHAEGRKQMEEDGRWTKYSHRNHNHKPAGFESTLESMMGSSAVVAIRSVGSTSILASQAATEAPDMTRQHWEGQRTETN